MTSTAIDVVRLSTGALAALVLAAGCSTTPDLSWSGTTQGAMRQPAGPLYASFPLCAEDDENVDEVEITDARVHELVGGDGATFHVWWEPTEPVPGLALQPLPTGFEPAVGATGTVRSCDVPEEEWTVIAVALPDASPDEPVFVYGVTVEFEIDGEKDVLSTNDVVGQCADRNRVPCEP